MKQTKTISAVDLKTPVDELDEGRSLDVRVSEKVLGETVKYGDAVPRFSKDTALALAILDRFRCYAIEKGNASYRVTVGKGLSGTLDDRVVVYASTVAVAICRAIVKSME